MFHNLMAAALVFLAGCDTPPGGGNPPGCTREGDGFDVKAMDPGPCCDGLTAANTTAEPDADGVCQEVDLNPAKVCIACGDGECGAAENVCNCPEECE